MFDFLKGLRDLRKAEIWGIVIIATLDLSAIITALAHIDILGVTGFFIFFGLLQLCVLPLCLYLSRSYSARLGLDDMHEAARNINITMEKTNELAGKLKVLEQSAVLRQEEVRKQNESLKNLPPV